MPYLRRLIETTNTLVTTVNRFRRYDVSDVGPTVNVNLGCGLAVAPGWVNIDGSLNAMVAHWPSPFLRLLYRASGANRYYDLAEYCTLLQNNRFIHHDLARGIPLHDHVADVVYSSHFLEHLYRREAGHLLREARRVLVPGGLIRISVPDLNYALTLYGRGEAEKMLAEYFFVEDIGSVMARHKYMYDEALLTAMLHGAGFSDVVRCSFRQGDCPAIDRLDNREEDSLFMEARA